MEGRALDRLARQGWAWLVPLVCGGLVGTLDTLGLAMGIQQAVAYVLGLGAGVAWQLLYRRDLVDRGWFIAVVFSIGAAMNLVNDGDIGIDASTATLVYLACVVVGLVLCERFLRWRDARAAAPAVPGDATRRTSAPR